ncbi:MAG TPA: cyclic nucleotide-binding domain-containing protein [Bacillota bacterium]|nr:cyclic nucleotide-binding domain-containing protein [Bacillota bacterium]
MKKIDLFDGALLAKINRISIFQYLTEQEKKHFLSIADLLEYHPGDLIITEGEVSYCFFATVSGSLKVTVRENAEREIPLSLINEGDIFGETGIFSDTKRTATVSPVDTALVMRIGRDDFFHFVRIHPRGGVKLLMMFIYGLITKLHDSNQERLLERKIILDETEMSRLFEKIDNG